MDRTRACYIPIPGTHGDNGEPTGLWWQSGSPFARFMYRAGLCHLNEDRPFTWSTDLNGHRVWRRFLGLRDPHRDWIACGYALSYYLWPAQQQEDYVDIAERNIVAHSHAGQGVFYACALGGLRINRLITIGTPVRRDMRHIVRRARPNIGQWLHIRSESDTTAIWGGIGDGAFGAQRTFWGEEDWTDIVPDIGHSGVLHDENLFHYWQARAWIEFLKNGW